jgi:hypothetical protein
MSYSKSKSVCFGVTASTDTKGRYPHCAINSNNVVIDVHLSQAIDSGATSKIWYRVARVDPSDLMLRWSQSHMANGLAGEYASCALTDKDVVLIIRSQSDGTLWFQTGQLGADDVISWKSTETMGLGKNPAVAMKRDGTLVVVYRDSEQLIGWRHGVFDRTTIHWGDSGTLPAPAGYTGFQSIALSESGKLLLTTETGSGGGTLTLFTGTLADLSSVIWNQSLDYGKGNSPSIAFTKDDYVVETHSNDSELYQMIGRVLTVAPNSFSVNWKDWLGAGRLVNRFDSGRLVQVASNDVLAIQLHNSEATGGDALYDLYGLVSTWFDRASWMGDHLATLKDKTLPALVLPAAHDAGMYLQPFPWAGNTQDLNLFSQLAYGVRYFDLRPTYNATEPFASITERPMCAAMI